ncbi:MAG TPA: hypothetical protein VNA25_28280 [Phycisphaerae bacterium]|nr:hypothetical protein [Phycisphaerae bacterium]
MTDPVPNSDPTPPRRRWLWVLYVLVLAVGVFAAWQARRWWLSRQEHPQADREGSGVQAIRVRPSRLSLHRSTRPSLLPATDPATQPQDMLQGFFEETDIQRLDEGPVGIDPPDGAAGVRAYRMPDGSVVARYTWTGTLAEASTHYEKTLGQQGCKLLDRSKDTEGYHYLKFSGEAKRIIVALRNDPRKTSIIDITVTVIQPAR